MILVRKNTTTTSSVRQTGPRKRILVTACCLGMFAAQWAQAQEQQATTATESSAQEQDVNTLDAVVVTGIRQSIAKSVETKNESNSIVEAISAEDIGKLPDLSIADSISRLPGLATQRVDGRSQVINIRGMSSNSPERC